MKVSERESQKSYVSSLIDIKQSVVQGGFTTALTRDAASRDKALRQVNENFTQVAPGEVEQMIDSVTKRLKFNKT